MSNHCVDVICDGCGTVFCLRGCGTYFKKGAEYLKKYKEQNPKPFSFGVGEHCSGKHVYDWSPGSVKL